MGRYREMQGDIGSTISGGGSQRRWRLAGERVGEALGAAQLRLGEG